MAGTTVRPHPGRGVRSLEDLEQGDHLCCVYEADEEHRQLLTPFLRQGLERREQVVYISDSRLATVICGYLRDDGLDPEPYLRSGQLVMLTSDDTYLREGSFDPDRMIDLLSYETERAVKAGWTGLRVTGEMTWALRKLPGCDKLVEYEAKLNRFFHANPVIAICQYDRRCFPPETLLLVLDTHPIVVIGGVILENFYYLPPADYLGPDRAAAELEQRIRNLKRHRRAQQQLLDSEARYRDLVEAIPHGITEIDTSGRILYANETYHRLHGYAPGELIGTNVADLAATESEGLDFRRLLVRLVEEQPPPLSNQTRRRHKNGEIFYLQADWRYKRDETGTITGMVAVITDISERKQAEERTLLANERLQYLLSSTSVVIYSARASGDLGVTFISDNITRISGWKERDFLEDSGFWLSQVHPEDRLRVLSETRKLPALGSHAYEYRFGTKDGRYLWIRDEMKLVRDNQGQPLEIIGYWIDITENRAAAEALRQSEERLRLVTESINEIFWMTDVKSSKTLYVSPAYERIFKRPLDELYENPRSWTDVVHGDDLSLVLEDWERQARGETTVHEYRIVLPDGTQRWIENRGYPVKNENGQVQYVAGVADDITERKSLEEHLRHAEKMDAIGQLAAGIAHDFNNHLGGIVGYADLLLEELQDEELTTYAERIVEAASSSSQLTSQLLAFARKEPHQLVKVNLNTTIERVVGLLRRTLERRISIRTRLTVDAVTTLGNKSQLETTLLNLGLNARDAMPRGGELVLASEVVTLHEHSTTLPYGAAPGRFVKISVSDNGIGMDEATRRRIFEPFFTTKEKGKGTGMGLAAVYGTVRSHGGAIEVTSKPGAGSTFSLYLPLSEEAEEREPAGLEPAAPSGPLRILIVDDDQLMREMLGQMLKMLGHEVHECSDGNKALDLYREPGQRFDLVILDMDMPNLDGQETYNALRQHDSELKAVLTSGYDMTRQAVRFLEEGGRAILQKPYRLAALNQIITMALR